MTKRRRPAASTIGSILVGFDQMILRDVPPAEELIAKARPMPGVSGRAPGFTVVFPADAEGEPTASAHGEDP